MSEHEDKRTQAQQDLAELGPVERFGDLEVATDVGASRREATRERLIQPNAVGYFEIEGGAHSGLGAPIHIGPELKKDGGTALSQYEAGYNAYAQPLRSTLRAMGRVKDVSLTGAPMTPTELMQRPALAARFRKLNPIKGDVQQDQAADVWSSTQTKMKIDIQRFGAGQHELAAVVANYRRAQQLLSQRQLEAKRASKAHELMEIKEAAEVLARIVDVSFEAWTAMSEIEELMDQKAAFDENAEGEVGAEHLPQSNNPDWVHGTADDPTGAGHPTVSKTQKISGAADEAMVASSRARAIVVNARAQLGRGNKVELSLQGLFVALTEPKKYADLQRDIAVLDAKIKNLELTQESEMIRSANEGLQGFKMEFGARRTEVRADRVASRKGAKTFAKSMGADSEGVMTMYAAEAYQELSAFGALASTQRKSMVDPVWGAVFHYLDGHDVHRYAAIGALDDARALAKNLQDVRAQQAYLAHHQPTWDTAARQWSEFIGQRTGSTLIAKGNEADRGSDAP